MALFRDGLLTGRAVALAGVSDGVRERLRGLGAHIVAPDGSLDETEYEQWARSQPGLHALIYDAGPAFADGGPDRLQVALERGWVAIRAIAAGSLIPAAGGKIVLIAPRPDSGPHAEAARAALENLARTLSVEWARYGITTTVIAPGARTAEGELAEVIAFLASEAGDYYSGCRLSLGQIDVIHAS